MLSVHVFADSFAYMICYRVSRHKQFKGASETQQGVAYLFNFGDASEYSFLTIEKSNMMADPNNLYGQHGALVHTVAEANDGLSFYIASGNISSGEFRLYGLKK